MEYVPTDDVLTERVFLGEIMDCWDGDPDQPDLSSGVIGACSGEWRREADGRWRFWQFNDE